MLETEGSSAESATSLGDILGAPESVAVAEPPQGQGGEATETVEQETSGAEEQQPVEGAEAEQPIEESDLAPEEGEVDYSDEVYSRYAQHFSKQWNQQLNAEDPVTRMMLKEIIQRGENFRRLQAEQAVEETPAEEAPEEGLTEEAPQADSPEQVQSFLQQIDRFAETRVRPEVAKVFLSDFMTAMWGDKGKAIASKATPEQAAGFTKVMTKFGYLFLNDALPQILNSYVPGMLEQQVPGFGTAMQDAVNEAAYQLLADSTDRNGQPMYPDLEELVFGEEGTLEQVYVSNPWLKSYKFVDGNNRLLPPVQQQQRRLEVAISMARGLAPAPELLRGAAEAGRQQAQRAARASSAGRLAPGESGGTFERQGDDADQLLKGMNTFGDRDRAIQDLLAPKSR